jgi:beta-aspartyl-peptidase (threonine type)
MFGKDLSNGAVANVKHIKNPISRARLVMEKTKHVLFAGDGAEKLAQSFGINLVDENYFIVPDELKNWLNKKESLEKNKGGTVGCVALDKYGNLAAATSTGGRFFKPPGRVGDSPLVNAGTYANNKTCAVSCTGTGEEFIRNTVAYKISALIEFKNYSLQRAADQLIFKVLKPGDGGLIAIDKNGNYVMPFSTKAMLRGVVTSNGVFETKIWK